MKKLILIPQFVDRGGKTVYAVHEDDQGCRTIRAGTLVGQMRIRFDDDATGVEFETIPQLDLPKGKKK